jgi:hypothetical protein
MVWKLALTCVLSPRRGVTIHVFGLFDIHMANPVMWISKERGTFPPLLEERAGVRRSLKLTPLC